MIIRELNLHYCQLYVVGFRGLIFPFFNFGAAAVFLAGADFLPEADFFAVVFVGMI